jgi:Co/Zn/Cd efflux system component
MSHGHHHDHVYIDVSSKGYRSILWIALALNAAMFVIEMAAGLDEGSVALQADAIDFLSDSMTFALTLFVLGRALTWRASAGLAKAAMMSVFGIWVVVTAVRQAMGGALPSPEVMGVVGFMALGVNVACAALLFRHREGDSTRRPRWRRRVRDRHGVARYRRRPRHGDVGTQQRLSGLPSGVRRDARRPRQGQGTGLTGANLAGPI